jgi:hypothetical protein
MIEYLIVILIIAAAIYYLFKKWFKSDKKNPVCDKCCGCDQNKDCH